MTEKKAEYNVEQAKKEQAALSQYAAIKNASEDTIGVSRVYLEMVDHDHEAALVLDEIMFWTLPQKRTGKTGLRIRRDGYLWLAVARTEWKERKGLLERQADRAINKLIDMGLIIKDNFYFDGKPRVHLRVSPTQFFALYGKIMTERYADEDQEETTDKELSDLYEMMGWSNLPNGKLRNGDSNLPNGEPINLPNGEFINSPDSPNTALNSIEGEAAKKPTVPEGFPIEWLIAHGNSVDQAQIDKLVMAKTACDKFEQVFAFHSLPWSVNGPWEQFERWVVNIYSDYPTMFQEYVDWRNDKTKGGGFYKAMSNKQIRTNPLMFIDTGYPEFEAGKMYQGKGNSNGKNSGNAQKTPQPEYTEEQLEQGRRILARQRERAGETGPG